MTDGKPGVMIRWDVFTYVKALPPEDAKRMIVAIGEYAKEGIEPDFCDSPVLPVLWSVISERIIEDDSSFLDKRKKRKAAANHRWRREHENTDANASNCMQDNANDANASNCMHPMPVSDSVSDSVSVPVSVSDNKKDNIIGGKAAKNRFVPPSVDDVRDYCRERGNHVDPERFVDFYETRGWMAGKTKMKDWKAAVRTWERNSFDQPQKPEKRPGSLPDRSEYLVAPEDMPVLSIDF